LKFLKSDGIKLLLRTKTGLIHPRDALEDGATITKSMFAASLDCHPTVHQRETKHRLTWLLGYVKASFTAVTFIYSHNFVSLAV
jgi:hypothetical protein